MDIKKNKPSDSALPDWLEALVGPLYLDFVAPFPLEETLRRIKAEEQLGFFRYRKVRVDLITHDADTFGFKIKKWGNKYAETEARGYLKRWGKNSTLVTGQVNLALYNSSHVPDFSDGVHLRNPARPGLVHLSAAHACAHQLAHDALHADENDDLDSPIQWEA